MPATRKTSPAARPAPAKSLAKGAAPAPAPGPAPASEPAKAGAAKPVKAAPAPVAVQPPKAVKIHKAPKVRTKPVRDSFTMPEADFALIATLKARALASQRETKKSELLRAGLHALAAMDAAALLFALQHLEPVKVGRPKKGH